MKLYYAPGACSMSVHLVLNEMGIKYETQAVDLRAHQTKGEDYYKINPKGSVPALKMDNGQILTEAAVVLQYVADQKPEARMIPPAGTLERYRCQEWLNYISSELHKGFGPLWNPQSTAVEKEKTQANLFKKFSYIGKHLATHDYLMGNQYSVADAYLFTILSWTRYFGMELTTVPALVGYVERIKSRPATLKTMQEEGLLK